MTKTMTAAAALLLGVALAASAQANSTMRQSANPEQQTAQTGTTTAPQIAKKRIVAKRMAIHHVASKRTGHKLMTAKLTHRGKLQQARLHRRGLSHQQQSTEVGSSTMPRDNTLNTLPPTTSQPLAGSGSSMLPQGQNTTLPSQQLNQPLNPAPIR